MTPAAEFNFWVDPGGGSRVFREVLRDAYRKDTKAEFVAR